MKRLVLSELSHPELMGYLSDIEVAVVPTGSLEQHGPNLTFSTDTDRAHEMAKLVGERLFPKVLICAPVAYGVSYHHMSFPGTVTLKPETLIAIYMEIAQSMKRHGINKILFLNAHGGNKSALSSATTRLRFEMEMRAAWIGSGCDMARDLLSERGASKIRGHSCEGEVSQSMYLAPWLVKKDALERAELKETHYQRFDFWGQVPWDFSEVSHNGALGDATRASRELGKEMTELALTRIEKFITDFYLD